MNTVDEIKTSIYNSSTAEKLIYGLVVIFIISMFGNFIGNWFSLSSSYQILYTKPWSIITYGFIHINFIHLFFNVIFLYYLGNLFLNFFSSKQFINYFVLGTLLGGISFLLLNPGGNLVGASAGIMAILVGLATKIPTYELRLNLIGGVKLWILALIYILVSISGLDGLNSGGNIAHLGGALIGFIYTKQLEKGIDIGKWIENLIDFIVTIFKPRSKTNLKTVYKKNNINRKPTFKESNKQQQQIDRILDKISKSGYDSLSKVEKDFLFKSGNKK